jgi:phage shock protein PspC (stress-responsive transcriptional regulator)
MNDIAADLKALRRPRDGRVAFGLCRAIALQFGVEVLVVRAIFTVSAALLDYTALGYVLGLWLVPALPKIPGIRTKRDKRQLIAFVLLFAATNQLLSASFGGNRTSAVMLIVVGLAVIHLRGRQLDKALFAARQQDVPSQSTAEQFAGGWTNTETAVPPRWGLAGEVLNPQLWADANGRPQSAGAPSASESRPRWRAQFGNVALVTLIGVLAIGLFTQNSRYSPVNQAVERERVGSEPVTLRTNEGIDRLADMEFGDGSFVVDASELDQVIYEPIQIEMGSGRLELILPKGAVAVGSVSQSGDGLLVVRNGGKSSEPGPVTFKAPQSWASAAYRAKSVAPREVKIAITTATASVCIRTSDHPEHCTSSSSK